MGGGRTNVKKSARKFPSSPHARLASLRSFPPGGAAGPRLGRSEGAGSVTAAPHSRGTAAPPGSEGGWVPPPARTPAGPRRPAGPGL